MKIKSIYKGMEVAANNVPDDVNVKLIIRHSIRPSLKNREDPDNVLLSSEGELMAKVIS